MLKIFHEEVVLNPSYHVMGQFSKFIRPGAKRLEADMSGSLKAVAFENADGSQVLVVMNETDDEVSLRVTGLKALVETTVHAKAFHTFVL
jgi:glucosylceramidase